jgi:predicted RNA-binding protein with PUA-like domain
MFALHCTALILMRIDAKRTGLLLGKFIKIYLVNYFLAKSEPLVYSISDLERDQTTTWDGIKSPQALQAVRAMRPKDRIFIYHSGGESQIVGLAEVVSEPRPDPKDPKLAVIDIKFRGKIDPPTTLSEVKTSHLFDDWALVRQSRLSTMAAPPEFVDWMKSRYPKHAL